MPKTNHKSRVSWFRLLYLLLVAIFIYILVSQISSLRGSLSQLRSSNIGDDLLVVAAIGVTFFCSGLTYLVLAPRRLHYLRTVAVEFGINSLNRLLPVGIGAIGANYEYLVKAGHKKIQAASVVAINNSLGVIGNFILLAVLLASVKTNPLSFGGVPKPLTITICVLVAAVIFTVLIFPGFRSRLRQTLKQFFKQLRSYDSRKSRLLGGLLSSMGLTLFNVLGLYMSLHAVHAHLGLSSLMLAYSFAIGLGAAIPAPGGAGSVDAGLAGALVAYHLPLSQAVAAVLVFRLISFWLPMILGVPALIWSRRRGYI